MTQNHTRTHTQIDIETHRLNPPTGRLIENRGTALKPFNEYITRYIFYFQMKKNEQILRSIFL